MRISGFDDPDSSGWDALHRGTEREGFDSPSKFDMSTLSTIMPKRKPARPKADPQGYTDEDTREWGSSADDEEYDDRQEYEEAEYTGGHRRLAEDGYPHHDHPRHDPSAERPRYADNGYPPAAPREFVDNGYPPASPREFADNGYPPASPREFADNGYPPAPPREFADNGYPPASREFAPQGYAGPHSPQYPEDGYDPAEPEWQDGRTYRPEPPPLEPAWTPPRGARPPAPPRPPAPAQHRPLAPRPPAPRPPVAPPPSWTPPPDPETRWIPQPEPWEDPAWNEPARVASPVPVASANSRVRPYTRTGGRTRSDHNLALEALVSTSDDGRRYRGVRSVEHRRICDLCLDTRSVAEIAAHLRLPLGVVKILVGDMADIGLVLIHQTELILGDRSSREFMERVLAGLRAL
ncbi:DUF742 domain-containing protein [Amycolatopsis sp. cmx-4-83]|uniref:DUF742 domain-containing protein n=1 Tax=Amycolatopsis sp. cmx-4-83 TaxID=2790940 RepID=UPI00397C2400